MPNFETSRTHNTEMGSVTEWVIRHAACPVLIHGRPSGPAPHLASSIEVTVHDWLGEDDGPAEAAPARLRSRSYFLMPPTASM